MNQSLKFARAEIFAGIKQLWFVTNIWHKVPIKIQTSMKGTGFKDEEEIEWCTCKENQITERIT